MVAPSLREVPLSETQDGFVAGHRCSIEIARHRRERFRLIQADAGRNGCCGMVSHFARACPRCNGYVDVRMCQATCNLPLHAVNGKCVRGRYRLALAWIVIRRGTRFESPDDRF